MGKTRKILSQELKKFYISKWEAVRKNPDYKKDYILWHEYNLKIKRLPITLDDNMRYNEVEKIQKEQKQLEKKLWKKYNITYINDPNDPDGWKHFSYSLQHPVKIIQLERYFDLLSDKKKFVKAKQKYLSYFYKRKTSEKDYIKHTLKDDRYLTLQIDTNRSKPVIMHYIEEYIDHIQKIKAKHRIGAKIDNCSHLRNIDRYYAVWDLVQKKKKGWSYKEIARKLRRSGWYKNQSLKQAENLARQDCRKARKEIGIISKTLKSSTKKPIIRLEEGKKEAMLFALWEEKLKNEDLGLIETLSNKALSENETIKLDYSKDGMTKKKIKGEVKTEEEIRERAWQSFKKKLRN